MRRLDETQVDPEIVAALDAIDATVAGDPVEPRFAELAELALLLTGERPPADPAFGGRLDELVSRRFEREPVEDGAAAVRSRRRWGWLAAGGAAVTAVVGVVAVVLALSGAPSGSRSGASSSGATSPSPSSSASVHSAASGAAVGRASTASTFGAKATVPPTGGSAQPPAVANLQPAPSGRKIIQSAQLSLSAAPDRVDDVAQEVFQVVGAQDAIVERSNVTQTGGTDGYAYFQLSVPSATLEQTMAKLSALAYSHVTSRTDTTQDVTSQYVDTTQRLANTRALRTSLLKQLANAVTTQQVDSLQAQINDADASISSDQATLRTLDHQISFSELSVTINAVAIPPVVSHSGGFTIGKGAHDAGRVLMVVAGVALIVLAALVPIALLAALGWWVGSALRRRRREQALDLA